MTQKRCLQIFWTSNPRKSLLPLRSADDVIESEQEHDRVRCLGVHQLACSVHLKRWRRMPCITVPRRTYTLPSATALTCLPSKRPTPRGVVSSRREWLLATTTATTTATSILNLAIACQLICKVRTRRQEAKRRPLGSCRRCRFGVSTGRRFAVGTAFGGRDPHTAHTTHAMPATNVYDCTMVIVVVFVVSEQVDVKCKNRSL